MNIANMTDNNTNSVLNLTPQKFEVHRGYDYEKILFGLFFVLLALSWLIIKPVKRRKDSKCDLSESSSLTRFLQSLPCAGISTLILTGLSIITTVLVTSTEDALLLGSEANIDRLAFVTIYLSFALTGIVDILCFYSYPRSLLPRHTDSLALALAFLTELLVISPSSPPVLVTVLCSLLVCLARLLGLAPASLSLTSLCLSSLSLAQGSWTLHTSLAASAQPLPGLFFSWHLLASFILCTGLSAGLRYLTQPRASSRPASEDLSNPTGLTVTINKEALARSDLGALGHLEATDTDNTSLTSVPSTQGVSVDSDEGQEEGEAGVRVSPLEEFNTLHRHREGVRKSIKLKESSIV